MVEPMDIPPTRSLTFTDSTFQLLLFHHIFFEHILCKGTPIRWWCAKSNNEEPSDRIGTNLVAAIVYQYSSLYKNIFSHFNYYWIVRNLISIIDNKLRSSLLLFIHNYSYHIYLYSYHLFI